MSQSLHEDGVRIQQRPGKLELDWAFWDPQLEAIDALESGEYDVVVFRGGYGSGKTILGSRWIIEQALAISRSDNLLIAPDSQKGAPTTYKVFFEQLPGEDTVPDEGGEPENSPIIAEYNRNESRLTLVNGSIIRLGSADVWNRYAGGEFNTIWCDEVAHYEHTDLFKLNRMLISRQRTDAGPNVTLWTSTGNGFNQFYDFVERQQTPDDDPIPTRIHNVVADSRNNPFLAEKDKLVRQFEGTEKEQQGLAGGFAASEGLVYDRFSRATHVVGRDAVDVRDDWRLYGYDYGFKDPRVLLEIGQTPADQYVVLDCYYRSQQPVEKLTGTFDGRRLVRKGWVQSQAKQPGRVFCDHEPEHYERFRNAGFDAQAAEKDIDEGINEVQSVLDTDADGRPGLLVVEDCTNLIQEFQSYKEDDVGTKRAEDHALDALRYAIMGDRYEATKTTRRRSGSSPTKGNLNR